MPIPAVTATRPRTEFVRLAQGSEKAVSEALRLLQGRTLEENSELIAPEACRHVLGSKNGFDAPGHRNQKLVAPRSGRTCR